MGKRSGRNVSGILLLDKPKGLLSNPALQRVKRLYQARKAGHTGSLDPIATGILPICLGEATKFSAFLLNADKRYRAECRLGVKTTTGDVQGEVVFERPVEGVSAATVDAALAQFRGEIDQTPPMHSAVKQQGQPLYKLAHRGLEVERAPRRIVIHLLERIDLAGDLLTLDVRCSKGAYIRTLAEEIGAALGCGAHVCNLRRTELGPYRVDDLATMERLEACAEAGGEEALEALDRLLLPVDSAVADLAEIRLGRDSVWYLRQGQPVQTPRAPHEGQVRLYDDRGRFLGVGEILDDGRVAPRRLVKLA